MLFHLREWSERSVEYLSSLITKRHHLCQDFFNMYNFPYQSSSSLTTAGRGEGGGKRQYGMLTGAPYLDVGREGNIGERVL